MSEEKMRIHTRVSPEMERKISAAMEKDNCQSRNEFLEKALKFYCDYLAAEDVSEFLPPIFVHAMRGTIQCSEDRIARLLFKLTVEIGASQLDTLRWQCVQEVKKTNGSITFKDTLKKHEGE